MKNNLTVQITKKYFYTMIIITTILVILPLVAKMFLSLRVWQGTEFFYPILYILNRSLGVWLIVTPLFIWFIVTYMFFRKMISYLEEMIVATKSLIETPNEKIVLRVELSEFENEINHIRIDSLENKKIAEEAEKKRDDLLTYLAHDLRTPLTSIIGYISLLQNEQTYLELDSTKRKNYIDIISDKANRLEHLLNDFFEIAKTGKSREEVYKEEVDLSLMLSQISSEFLPLLDEKKLEWDFKIEPNVFVQLNINKFERVLDNLIRNAISYSLNDTTIKLTLEKVDEKVVVSVGNITDKVSEKDIDQLFEPFYRGDQSRNTKTGNAGLGLAIAKQIISEHGGTIEAELQNNYFKVSIIL
ncbi:HAMP domain-containing histidine kinase [Enterococcus faecalis]|nr:HAMP domain-containing histidine kinase [Enterococcus faecalis]EGO6705279.1 HAMP domain-containing histidine kinase [Enterococcus faecalis]